MFSVCDVFKTVIPRSELEVTAGPKQTINNIARRANKSHNIKISIYKSPSSEYGFMFVYFDVCVYMSVRGQFAEKANKSHNLKISHIYYCFRFSRLSANRKNVHKLHEHYHMICKRDSATARIDPMSSEC